MRRRSCPALQSTVPLPPRLLDTHKRARAHAQATATLLSGHKRVAEAAYNPVHNPQSRAQCCNVLHRVATCRNVVRGRGKHVALYASGVRSPAALCSADPPPLSDGAAPRGIDTRFAVPHLCTTPARLAFSHARRCHICCTGRDCPLPAQCRTVASSHTLACGKLSRGRARLGVLLAGARRRQKAVSRLRAGGPMPMDETLHRTRRPNPRRSPCLVGM